MHYESRQSGVEAKQHIGPKILVTSHLKGEQTAESGDFLVVDPEAVKRIRDQEKFEGHAEGALGNKQTVYVVKESEFRKLYDVQHETPGKSPETSFKPTEALDVNKAPKSNAPDEDRVESDQTATFEQKTEYPRPLEPGAFVPEGATAPMHQAGGEVLVPAPEADLRDPATPEVERHDEYDQQ